MTAPVPTPAKKTPAPASHGWRVTWPMILGWLGILSLLAPMVAPYLTGEKKLDAAGICAVLAALVGALNHSPVPSSGGGLPRPPTTALLLVLALPLVLLVHGCGANALKVHAVVASTAGESINVAGDTIVRTEGGEINTAVAGAHTEAEGRAALAVIHDRWAPIVAAHDALAAAQRGYVAGIVEVAAEHATLNTLFALAGVLWRAWGELATKAAALGVHVPRPPSGLISAASDGGTP
jgi:hypothetical protein